MKKQKENKQLLEILQSILKTEDYNDKELDSLEKENSVELKIILTLIKKIRDRDSKIQELEQESFSRLRGIAHDLKTPTAHIASFFDLLYGNVYDSLSKKDRILFSIINDATHSLAFKIDSLRSYTKIVSSEDNNINLLSVVNESLTLFRLASISKKVDFKILVDNIININFNHHNLRRILDNLIENAIKFANFDSTIIVSAYILDRKAVVSVTNHGEKMSEENKMKIFTKGHTTIGTNKEVGTGLGLLAIKEILNDSDQSIEFDSNDGITKFTFTMDIVGLIHWKGYKTLRLPQCFFY